MNPPQTSTPRRSCNLGRDQRLQVFTLSKAGFSQKQIAAQLGFTIRQVGYTLRSGQVSPKKRTETRTKLNPEQVDELVAFVIASGTNRQMSYLELSMHFSQWNVGEGAIKGALARRGFARCRVQNGLTITGEKKDKKSNKEKNEKNEGDELPIDQSSTQRGDNCGGIEHTTKNYGEGRGRGISNLFSSH